MKKIISIIIGMLLCFTFVGCGSDEKKETKNFHELETKNKYSWVMKIGEDYVKETLKNPDDAKFDLPTVKTLSDGKTFELKGFVTATNSFGGKVKQPYSMKISFPNDGLSNVDDSYEYQIKDYELK